MRTFVLTGERTWYSFVYRYLVVTAFSSASVVVCYAIWPSWSYLAHWVYAQCIGTACWAIIEAGAFLLHRPTDPSCWPHGARAALLVIVGVGLGFYCGSWLANMLPGTPALALHDRSISALITINPGIACAYFLYSRNEQALLSAKISAAERDVAEARLKLLTAQLEPHMLFNTLANLRALIASDPQRALAMLDRLDRYLRVTLSGSMALMHPLAAEFDRLADYLALMQVRMGPRLRYSLELPDELRHVSVPPLLLQPLVENSIRHGLGPKVEGGQITVRARRDGQRLVIETDDTGIGLDKADTATGNASGFGLGQVRTRLVSVYGEAAALELTSTPDSGTRAILVLPLETLERP